MVRKARPPAPSAPISLSSYAARPLSPRCTRRGRPRQPLAAPLISKDGKSGLVVAGITGGGTDGQKHAKALAERLGHDRDGVTVRVGGAAMADVQINCPIRT